MIYPVERYPCVVGAAGFMFPQAEQKLPASNVNDVKMKKDPKQTSHLLELWQRVMPAKGTDAPYSSGPTPATTMRGSFGRPTCLRAAPGWPPH